MVIGGCHLRRYSLRSCRFAPHLPRLSSSMTEKTSPNGCKVQVTFGREFLNGADMVPHAPLYNRLTNPTSR